MLCFLLPIILCSSFPLPRRVSKGIPGLIEEYVEWPEIQSIMLYESGIHESRPNELRGKSNRSRRIYVEGMQRGSRKRVYLGHARFEANEEDCGQGWHVSKVHVAKEFRGRRLGTKILCHLFTRYPKQKFYMYSDWNNPEFSPGASYRCYVRSALACGYRVFHSNTAVKKPKFARLHNYDKLVPKPNAEWVEIANQPFQMRLNGSGHAVITPKSLLLDDALKVESWRVLLFVPDDKKYLPRQQNLA